MRMSDQRHKGGPMAIDPKLRELLELVFCYDRQRVNAVNKDRKLIAHYTTAETAMKIIDGRSIWLRNAGVMNDYAEIEHGRAVMEPVLLGPLGNRFRELLNGVNEGLGQRLYQRYSDHCKHARETVFMVSLAEHDPVDDIGKLSMWRAYGGRMSGVALLLKGEIV